MSTQVSFGGVPATNVKVLSPTSLTATVPAGTGVVDVMVSTTGGSDTEAGAYTYVPAPGMTALNPPTGPETGGNQVTITGTNFEP